MTTAVTTLGEQIEQIRGQFPALARQHQGRPLLFFDGPAGTQAPQCVMDAMVDYLSCRNANHGGAFVTSVESDAMLDQAHRAFAEFVGGSDPGEVFFGQNMTSLTFALSRSLAQGWTAGDEIIVTRLDHDANVTPWVLAAEDAGVVVRFVDIVGDECCLDFQQYENLLNERTRLVAVGAASNATGGLNDIRRWTDAAHKVGALVYVDAVHYGPHGLIDVAEWGCDFLACSMYKFFGPHLGMVWGRRELLEPMRAYKVRPADDQLPGKWMTGTQSHESIAGALECVNYLCRLSDADFGPASGGWRTRLRQSFARIAEYEFQLASRFVQGLQRMDGIRVVGISDLQRFGQRVSTFSIVSQRLRSPEFARQLAQRNICVWHGHYYALQLTEALGLEPDGMVRIGFVHYNTEAEVDQLLAEIESLHSA